jgi:hypothetical protein
MKYAFLILIGMINIQGFAQSDSLIFENRDVIVGEVKSMDQGVLKIETDYSDVDFAVKWVDIKEIYTTTYLLVSTTDGERTYGRLKTIEGKLYVMGLEGDSLALNFDDVVYLKEVDRSFWDRLYAGIDFGFTITRARNQRQVTLRSRIGYLAEKWSLDANYNTLASSQDDVEDIERTDGNVTFKYVLPHEWFILVQVDFLSNTEQLLVLRNNMKVGAGNYLLRTNQYYWGIQGGISQNNENYEGEDQDRNSQELWFGTGLNLYDIGDLSLNTTAVLYQSLTDNDRRRFDFGLDLKYDLPLDFYIKTGYTLNYDNQPVDGAQRSDFVLQTTFGWEW